MPHSHPRQRPPARGHALLMVALCLLPFVLLALVLTSAVAVPAWVVLGALALCVAVILFVAREPAGTGVELYTSVEVTRGEGGQSGACPKDSSSSRSTSSTPYRSTGWGTTTSSKRPS